jgi:hypothetical protein
MHYENLELVGNAHTWGLVGKWLVGKGLVGKGLATNRDDQGGLQLVERRVSGSG